MVDKAQVQEALAGESSQPLDGTASPQQLEELDRVAGMMAPATNLTTTAATPGATASTKTIGHLYLEISSILVQPMQLLLNLLHLISKFTDD